jgi:hypothetical protein
MGHKERDLISERLAHLAPNERLFRINAGMGWAGRAVRVGDKVVIKNPYPLHAAPEGWPDLCGWRSVTITPDMVGQTVAVFVGEEVKATGKASARQSAFGDLIKRMGGIFRIISH